MRIAIFIDGRNLFYAQKEMGWQIDYRKLLEYFAQGNELIHAFYFTATPPFNDTRSLVAYRKFKKFLIHSGYTVVDKDTKLIQGRPKGNLDIEMTMYMITTVPHYDRVIFLSGDGDFVPVIDYLIKLGKLVTCVSLRRRTALELINICSEFIDIESLRDKVEK